MKISYRPQMVHNHLASEIKLSDVMIDEKPMDVTVTNMHENTLCVEFGCGFSINVSKYIGVVISRERHRPKHDHGDTEYLCFEKKTNELSWRTDQEMGKNYQRLKIPFGSVTVDE